MLNTQQIKRIAKATFETKSRKFSVVARATYTMSNYWDGGSREYAVAMDLATGETRQPDFATTNPFNGQSGSTFAIPAGIGILTHGIFCGKDCGLTLYVSPGNALASPANRPECLDVVEAR
jgi:hypothetical protein